MPDPQHPDDPRWDWLFTPAAEPDWPTAAPPPGTAEAGSPPAQPPAGTGVGGSAAGPGDVPSFGGTYPRPPRSRASTGAAGPTASGATGSGTAGGQQPNLTRPLPRAESGTGQPAAQPALGRAPAPLYASYGRPPGTPSGTPRQASGAPTPPHRRRIRWVRILLAVLVAWLIFLLVVPLYAWSRVAKVPAEPSGARPVDGPGTTYLLVGSDSRAGLSTTQKRDLGTGSASGQRTDTIILLHVTDSGGPNVMVSVPRDSYVAIPGHSMGKINAAYAYGGAKLLVQTVEQATGVRIDDYVEIGFTGVVDIVDAVGGITVCPKTSIVDPNAGHLRMDKGCQEVNGHIALDYSRSRAFPLGDITRTQHQREVIGATGSKAASWQTVVLPWRYWRVNMAGADSVTVGDNVGPIDFARFAWALMHSGGSGTKRCVVPYTSLGTPTAVGSVVTWDKAKADALFTGLANDNTSAIHCSPTG